jgi:hypothetical protein
MVSRHSIILLEIYVNVLVEVRQHDPPSLKVSLEFVILLWFQPYGRISGPIIDV